MGFSPLYEAGLVPRRDVRASLTGGFFTPGKMVRMNTNHRRPVFTAYQLEVITDVIIDHVILSVVRNTNGDILPLLIDELEFIRCIRAEKLIPKEDSLSYESWRDATREKAKYFPELLTADERAAITPPQEITPQA